MQPTISVAAGLLTFWCCAVMAHGQAAAPKQKQEQPTQLAAEIGYLDGQIALAEAENARYAGGLVKSLIELRLATLKQTKSMLEQRAAANVNGVNLRYTVDGRAFTLPAGAREQLASVEADIVNTEAEAARQQAEADRYSGGLVQAMSLATVATTKQTLAMLQQKRLALKYGLPQYIGFGEAPSTSAPTASSRAANKVSAPPAVTQPDQWEIVEVDARVTETNDTWWKYAWKLTLRNNSTVRMAFEATIEFQDKDGFVVDDDRADGPLVVEPGTSQTFTGYDLVTTGAATKIMRTSAKVRPAR